MPTSSAAGIRRLCVAVAPERFAAGLVRARSGPGTRQAPEYQAAALLARACGSAGLDRALMGAGHQEDAEVVLLPVGIDEPRAVAALVEALLSALRLLNAGRPEQERTRLRMAVHEGLTFLTSRGFTGQALTRVRDLASSEVLRRASAEHPEADLLVMLSDQVYVDVTQFTLAGLPGEWFQPVRIPVGAGGADEAGWIMIPGRESR